MRSILALALLAGSALAQEKRVLDVEVDPATCALRQVGGPTLELADPRREAMFRLAREEGSRLVFRLDRAELQGSRIGWVERVIPLRLNGGTVERLPPLDPLGVELLRPAVLAHRGSEGGLRLPAGCRLRVVGLAEPLVVLAASPAGTVIGRLEREHVAAITLPPLSPGAWTRTPDAPAGEERAMRVARRTALRDHAGRRVLELLPGTPAWARPTVRRAGAIWVSAPGEIGAVAGWVLDSDLEPAAMPSAPFTGMAAAFSSEWLLPDPRLSVATQQRIGGARIR